MLDLRYNNWGKHTTQTRKQADFLSGSAPNNLCVVRGKINNVWGITYVKKNINSNKNVSILIN